MFIMIDINPKTPINFFHYNFRASSTEFIVLDTKI